MRFIVGEFKVLDAVIKNVFVGVGDGKGWERFAVASENVFGPRELVLVNMGVGDHVNEFAGFKVEDFGHSKQ